MLTFYFESHLGQPLWISFRQFSNTLKHFELYETDRPMFSPFVQKTICETLIWKSNIFFAQKKAFTFDIFFCIDFDFSEAPFMMKSDFKKNKYFLQIVLSKVLGEIFETVTKAQLDPCPALVSIEKCSFLTLRSIWNIWSLLNEALI